MINQPGFTPDRKIQGKIIDAEHARLSKQIERGAMGRLLGAGKEKPGNLVAFAIIVACLMIILLAAAPLEADVPRKELIMLIAGVIPGALGYYFGYLSASKNQE